QQHLCEGLYLSWDRRRDRGRNVQDRTEEQILCRRDDRDHETGRKKRRSDGRKNPERGRRGAGERAPREAGTVCEAQRVYGEVRSPEARGKIEYHVKKARSFSTALFSILET